VSARQEPDEVEVLSGVYEGLTLGTPIAMLVRNRDARSQDYADLASGAARRIGHADDVWRDKYSHVDPRGGGRASGRETLSRVMAAAVAEMWVRERWPDIEVVGLASRIGAQSLSWSSAEIETRLQSLRRDLVDACVARFPDTAQVQAEIEKSLVAAVRDGESYGGEAWVVVRGVPRGLGQPVFRKLKNHWADALMSVGATSSFALGLDVGDAARADRGTEFHRDGASALRYGGVRGGLATGELMVARVGFKPTSSVMDISKRGRHDPCIVPRAVPVLEAMTWLLLADQLMLEFGTSGGR
jgi:chorismate synthase